MRKFIAKVYSLMENHPIKTIFLLFFLFLIIYPQSYISNLTYPFDPKLYLMQRFFTWNEIDLGSINPSNPSGIIFSLTEAIAYELFGHYAKKITFAVLSTLAGISMCYFVSKMTDSKIVQITAAIIYALSFCNITSWEAFEPSRIGLLATLPLILALLIDGLEEKSVKHFIFASFLIAFSGMGLTLLFLVFATPVLYLTVSTLFTSKNYFNKESVKSVLSFYLIVFLINAYWILPLIFGPKQHPEIGFIQLNKISVFLIPLLAFIGLLIEHRNKFLAFAAVLSIIGLSLTFDFDFSWIGASVSSDFSVFVIFGYSILAAVALGKIYSILVKKTNWKLALTLVFIILVLCTPIVSSTAKYVPSELFGIAYLIDQKKENGTFRTIVILEDIDEKNEVLRKFTDLINEQFILGVSDANCSLYKLLYKHDNFYGLFNIKYVASKNELGYLKKLGNIDLYNVYELPESAVLPRIYSAVYPILVKGNESDMFKLITFKEPHLGSFVFILLNLTDYEKLSLLKRFDENMAIKIEVIKSEEIATKFPKGNIYAITYSNLSKTVVHIRTYDEPLTISYISEDGRIIGDITIPYEAFGMRYIAAPKVIPFLLKIPSYSEQTIEINHAVTGNLTLHLAMKSPTIVFKRVNPTKYIVEVENTHNPFFLVLSNSFDERWKVYIEDKVIKLNKIVAEYDHVNVYEAKPDNYRINIENIIGDLTFLFKEPLNEKYHFVANSYVNAWYIDPKIYDGNGDGKFTVTIYYVPQSIFYLGALISILSSLFFITLLLYEVKSKRPWSKK